MIREGLVLLPAGIKPLNLETFEGRNGGRQNRTQVEYTFKMIHAPTGQSEPVVVIGEAIDVGDKSSNKAMTAARKYALIMAFNIETGLDPDDTPSADQERAPARGQQPATPQQLRQQHPELMSGSQLKQPAPKPTTLPADGKELFARLKAFEGQLAKENLTDPGALVAHVRDAGVKAGYPADLTAWTGPAIPFAVEVVKEFDQKVRGKQPAGAR